jgi:late competence protein required for DNA uptake (superfamily II DNA/RNA helicase)
VLQALKRTAYLFPFMVEPTLETEKAMPESIKAKEEQEISVPFLEEEIECPRCHDNMMLCSDFDHLYYVCEVCDFCLFTIKKSAS